MASGYSANQYDSAFKSKRLQNWCQPKHFKERPTAKLGHTSVIVDDKGHLLPQFKQKGSSWPGYKGTWDLPNRIPCPRICLTARSEQGLNRLETWGFITPRPDTTKPPGGSKNTESRSGQLQTEEAVALEDAAQTQTPSLDGPVNEGERERTPTPECPENTVPSETADRDMLQICQ